MAWTNYASSAAVAACARACFQARGVSSFAVAVVVRVSTSAKYANGSTPSALQLSTSEYKTAARWALSLSKTQIGLDHEAERRVSCITQELGGVASRVAACEIVDRSLSAHNASTVERIEKWTAFQPARRYS